MGWCWWSLEWPGARAIVKDTEQLVSTYLAGFVRFEAFEGWKWKPPVRGEQVEPWAGATAAFDLGSYAIAMERLLLSY